MAMSEAKAVAMVAAAFEAWVAVDIEAMAAALAPDFVQWHSHIGRDFTKAEHRALLETIVRHVDFNYHDISYVALDGGAAVLVRCLCDLSVRGGESARNVPFGLVYQISDGAVRRCDEYMDGRSLPDMSAIF